MQAVDLAAVSKRADVDAGLAPAVPEASMRGFLLQNLRREGDGWRWQPNIEVIGRDIATIGGWPTDVVGRLAPFEGPVLWLSGERSPYVTEDNHAEMRRLFPRVRHVRVKDAAHWVHSEQPEVTIQSLRVFITGGR